MIVFHETMLRTIEKAMLQDEAENRVVRLGDPNYQSSFYKTLVQMKETLEAGGWLKISPPVDKSEKISKCEPSSGAAPETGWSEQ